MDYNIYIHSIGSQNNESPTTPWNNDEPKGDGTTSWQPSVSKALSVASNPDSLVSMGVGAIKKAIPAIAVAGMVVGVGMRVYDTALRFTTAGTGDYRATMERQNFKAKMKWVFSPLSTAIEYYANEQAIRLEDDRRAMESRLLGDSVLNSQMGRGV